MSLKDKHLWLLKVKFFPQDHCGSLRAFGLQRQRAQQGPHLPVIGPNVSCHFWSVLFLISIPKLPPIPHIKSVEMPDWSEVGGKLLTLSMLCIPLYNRENSSYSVGSCVLNEIMYIWHPAHSGSLSTLKKCSFI